MKPKMPIPGSISRCMETGRVSRWKTPTTYPKTRKKINNKREKNVKIKEKLKRERLRRERVERDRRSKNGV